jgi:hypothetical protein
MKKKTYTLKEINYHIKDERGAVQEYKKDKLSSFARDEAKHLRFWEEQKKNRKGKA